jgi:hypothetical protein
VRIPEKRLCDLCKNEIDLTRAYPTLTYPLDLADFELLMAPGTEPRREILMGLTRAVPGQATCYQFDLCRGCVDGFLPMLADLKTEFIRRFIEERERRFAGRT